MRRPCIRCGKLIASGSRCARHQGEHLAAKRLKYGNGWREHSKLLRRNGRCEWRMPDGSICGTTIDLTLDHPDEYGQEHVLCRTHNSQKGGRDGAHRQV